jgi:hypothetical protein
LTYKKKNISQLKALATAKFNHFIRERDREKGCISCGGRVQQAGHFYSAGQHPELRYNEDNVQGQCLRCNYFLSGNLNEYRKHLEQRIGVERVKKLDETAAYHRRHGYKWNRFFLIEIIEKYDNKNV